VNENQIAPTLKGEKKWLKCQKTNFGSEQRDVVRDLMPRGGSFTDGEDWTFG
jgi:hypothetical protein